MTHSPEDIIKQLLIDLSLGTTPADAGSWPIYSLQEPNTDDNLIVVYGTEGRLHGRNSVTSKMAEHYGIQIAIRSNSPTAGHTKANAVAVAIDQTASLNAVTITSSVYVIHSVNRVSGPINAGTEPDSKRYLTTINALTSIRQTI